MRHDVMACTFAASVTLPTCRHSPVKQRVEPRPPLAARDGFDMLQESREAPDDFATIEILGDGEELPQWHACFSGARIPKVGGEFFRLELALEGHQDAP